MCKNRYFSNADAKVATFSEPANISASFLQEKYIFALFGTPYLIYIKIASLLPDRGSLPRIRAREPGPGGGEAGARPVPSAFACRDPQRRNLSFFYYLCPHKTNDTMNLKKISLLILLLLVADQALKIWVKTHMHLDEAIMVFPDWFQLRFIENSGAAFGMRIATSGGYDWGKLLLGIFRIVMVGALGWLLVYLHRNRKDTPRGVMIGLALIIAGALGNILDSAFYGLIFTESTPYTVAQFGGHYAGFMMGKVVDMFYFPLFQWNSVPRLLRFLVDSNNYFFGAIFNLADAYISVAVVYMLLFQYKFFSK